MRKYCEIIDIPNDFGNQSYRTDTSCLLEYEVESGEEEEVREKF